MQLQGVQWRYILQCSKGLCTTISNRIASEMKLQGV